MEDAPINWSELMTKQYMSDTEDEDRKSDISDLDKDGELLSDSDEEKVAGTENIDDITKIDITTCQFKPINADRGKKITTERNKVAYTILEIMNYYNLVAGFIRKYMKLLIDSDTTLNDKNTNELLNKFSKPDESKDLENSLIVKFDKEYFLEKINWVRSVSIYFSTKLGLKIFPHQLEMENNTECKIARSSYKFCEESHNCRYNYGARFGNCNKQHFVFNMIVADIDAIIDHVKTCEQPNLEQLTKSMNTISFVINHMYNELQCLNYYKKCNIDNIEMLSNKHLKIKKQKVKQNKHAKKKVVSQDGWISHK